MAVNKSKKSEVLNELIEKMKASKCVVFSDIHGTNVKDLKDLRRKLKTIGADYKVAKKTLIKLAAKEIGYKEIPDESLSGEVGAAFSMEDEVAAAKTIFELGKKNKNLKLLGALLEGKVLTLAEAKQLATMPGKEELLAKFIYVIKSPISGFHGVLHGTMSGFVRALKAISEKQTA